MAELKEGDSVIVMPPKPVVGKVIRVWTSINQVEVGWPSGFTSVVPIANVEKVAK